MVCSSLSLADIWAGVNAAPNISSHSVLALSSERDIYMAKNSHHHIGWHRITFHFPFPMAPQDLRCLEAISPASYAAHPQTPLLDGSIKDKICELNFEELPGPSVSLLWVLLQEASVIPI